MCDYSLESADQRDAKADDMLLLASLGACGTKGFVAPAQKHIAVCMCAGTRLVLQITERMRSEWGFEGLIARGTFSQRDPTGHNMYRDGVVFDAKPGQHYSLQDFDLGVSVSVELLPGQTIDDEARVAPAPDASRSAAIVRELTDA